MATGPEDAEAAAERRAKAYELHLAGASAQQIADRVGFPSAGAAQQAVREALDARGDLDQRRVDAAATELGRLDALLISLWPKARGGDLQAVDRVLKINERRAAVLSQGIDAPVEPVEPEGTPLDEFTRRLHDRQATASPPGRT